MNTLLVLVVMAVLAVGAFHAVRRYALVRIEADRRAELTRAACRRRRAEAQISRLTASAVHQMVEVARRSHVDPPSPR